IWIERVDRTVEQLLIAYFKSQNKHTQATLERNRESTETLDHDYRVLMIHLQPQTSLQYTWIKDC
ncbi:hypothetical protein BCR33DRAFT_711618, partial [Rhizoclosmatium globosum]